MAIKKSELYSSLWKSCDELRGGMDASQYKDYVLVLLFVKYVSDKYAGQKDALLDVPKGGRFGDMVTLNGDKEIGDKMNKIISSLAEANDAYEYPMRHFATESGKSKGAVLHPGGSLPHDGQGDWRGQGQAGRGIPLLLRKTGRPRSRLCTCASAGRSCWNTPLMYKLLRPRFHIA
jgi:type I restriction-modification system DNA methylase subunit